RVKSRIAGAEAAGLRDGPAAGGAHDV
ncbi:MAG: hypothetical protein JWP29_1851, partial [Rhodoferax sp.]|nr:hypothetical protein [Rhodoferax sp.]